jgi:hypothetical protein
MPIGLNYDQLAIGACSMIVALSWNNLASEVTKKFKNASGNENVNDSLLFLFIYAIVITTVIIIVIYIYNHTVVHAFTNDEMTYPPKYISIK